MRPVLVVGGGAAGLSCALTLQDQGTPVTVLEAGPRLGGRIGTLQEGSYRVEQGPATLQTDSPGLAELITRLQLTDQRVLSDPRAARRYVFHGGRLREVPDKPQALLASDVLPLRAKLRLLCEPLIGRGADPDESIGAFTRRRLGPQVATLLVDAALGGIYAGDLDALSLRSAFPRVAAMEDEHGSLLRAMGKLAKQRRQQGGPPPSRGVQSFAEGLQQLPDALGRAITQAGGAVRTDARVVALTRSASGFEARLAGGESLQAPRVVLALPPPAAAALTGPLDAELAAAYGQIPMAPVVALTLALDREMVRHPLDGFGVLLPRCAGLRMLGTIFMSSALPGFAQAPAGQVVLRLMYGGVRDAAVLELSDAQLVELALRELAQVLPVQAPAPRFFHVQRWPAAIEQYTRGHGQRVATISARASALGLAVCGAALHGISVPDALADGRRAAAELIKAG